MSKKLLINCIAIVAVLGFLGGCGEGKIDNHKNSKLELQESRGSLTGGGLFNNKSSENGAGGPGIGVNSFLWRATLDTLAFMPLTSADPFGGVIITDWYEDPKTAGARFKVNALIIDKTLRADGVKITVFKQQMDKKGKWRDVEVEKDVARHLEDAILTRAREMRLTQAK